MRKLLTVIFALLVYVLSTNAQVNGSIKLGVTGYQGDLHCNTDESIGYLDNLNAALGIGVHVPFSKLVGLRGELTYFRLSGDDSNFQNTSHANRGWSFTNNILELSALLDYEPLGKRRFKHGRFRRTITPVIFGGVGLGFTNTKVDWNNDNNSNINEDNVFRKNAELALPIGIGLKYYHSEKLAFGLEGGLRLPVSDYYDGVSRAGNPDNNDSYAFLGLKAYFGLGGKNDEDGDGIVDRKDACPSLAGLKELNGCPDSDYDGVADNMDQCPNKYGVADLAGCPDSDGDGIKNSEDNCPDFAGPKSLNGCPDKDGDGVYDHLDLCPDVASRDNKYGCPDQDGDGVFDHLDECPHDPGVRFKKGCPLIDSDGDGIEDDVDKCPNQKGSSATDGCPDFDDDGIADKDDKCIQVAGKAPNGCPDGIIPPRKNTRKSILEVMERTTNYSSTPTSEYDSAPACRCEGNTNVVFNIPKNALPKSLSRLGSNPEFGDSHGLDAFDFYKKLNNRYNSNARDKRFLDDLFRGMGYASFAEATPELFTETQLERGTIGNIGFSKNHRTLYGQLNVTSDRDLMAFRIQAANGCDIHFMKTCGNHFFFCK